MEETKTNWYTIDEYTQESRLMTDDEIASYINYRQAIIDEEWHTENGGEV